MGFSKGDMLYADYKWRARDERDDPRVTGEPDSTLLDRNEGYEVLYFINKIGEKHFAAPVNLGTYQKVERLLRSCPGNIRSQEKIRDWVIQNWKI